MAGTSFQQRRGASALWAATNPVLADGEFGYEKDTGVVKMGNGVSTWNQLQPILGSSYLPILGKAADSERLDGYDSTAFTKVNYAEETYAKLTNLSSFGRDRGSGNTWPTADNRRGDVYYNTDVSQLGVFDGANGWRLLGVGRVATSALRDAITWVYPGLRVRVDADGLVYEYQNAFLAWTRPWNDAWGELHWFALAVGQVLQTGYAEYGWGVYALPKGRKIRLRGMSTWYSASSVMTTVRTRILIQRDANPMPTTVVYTGPDIDTRLGGPATDLGYVAYDGPYVPGGTLGKSPVTRFSLQGCWAGGAPNSSVYPAGDASQQNYLSIIDAGPSTAPPTS